MAELVDGAQVVDDRVEVVGVRAGGAAGQPVAKLLFAVALAVTPAPGAGWFRTRAVWSGRRVREHRPGA